MTTACEPGRWIKLESKEDLEAALRLARGSYQVALLRNHHAWDGSTLKPHTFWQFGQHITLVSPTYARSRASLAARLTKAGIPFLLVADYPRGPLPDKRRTLFERIAQDDDLF